MMHSMNTTGMDLGFGFSALWAIHVLATVAFFVGIALLLVWAVKTLTLQQLRSWAIGLTVGGAVLCLLTVGALGRPWTAGETFGAGRGASMMRMDRGSMGGGMMHDDDDDDGMGMSMAGMNAILEGKTGDAFDEAFIRMMIPHHQGAIDMAEAAKKSAKHQEIKDMADDIISAQQREIDMMKGWLDSWGYDE